VFTGMEDALATKDFGVWDTNRLRSQFWRETAEADANHETLIRDLLDDQYSRPRRIVAFNKSADAGSDTDFLQVNGP